MLGHLRKLKGMMGSTRSFLSLYLSAVILLDHTFLAHYTMLPEPKAMKAKVQEPKLLEVDPKRILHPKSVISDILLSGKKSQLIQVHPPKSIHYDRKMLSKLYSGCRIEIQGNNMHGVRQGSQDKNRWLWSWYSPGHEGLQERSEGGLVGIIKMGQAWLEELFLQTDVQGTLWAYKETERGTKTSLGKSPGYPAKCCQFLSYSFFF